LFRVDFVKKIRVFRSNKIFFVRFFFASSSPAASMLPRKIFKNFLISFQAEECLLFLLRLRRLLPSRAAADRLPATAEKRAAAANLTEAAAAAAAATSRRKNLRGRPKL